MATIQVPEAQAPDEGEIATIDVDGTAVAVTRVRGTLFAFQDACTHAACSLSEGEMEGRNVVCPCHMGTFDVTSGAVVSGPPPAPLKTWQVETA